MKLFRNRRVIVCKIALLFTLFFAFSFGCNSATTDNEKELLIPKANEASFNGNQDGQKENFIYQDSIRIKNAALVKDLYARRANQLLWSSNGVLQPEADSLVSMINSALSYGLFPTDYHQQKLTGLKNELKKQAPGVAKINEAQWSAFDMYATSAFVQFVKDIKVGRLLSDSVLVKDSSLTAEFFDNQREQFEKQSVRDFVQALEPAMKDYHQLKSALAHFLSKANLKPHTHILTTDSLLLPVLVYKRIAEEDSLKIKPVKELDSTIIAITIVKYQKWKKLRSDGKITPVLIKNLNETDREKFIRIAIAMDKYKMLQPLPQAYIWVNLPGYYLEVREGDSVLLKSKIICGKPATKTPQLTSAITDMITYPKWTIPPGIIKKEVLPALQRDPGYIQRKGFSLVDNKGEEVNPYKVKWSKYTTGIPYQVVQGSGDANALGVMKFNFPNPYAVYLHDTNQRYLFSKSSRALSHGCVRVQQWRELAHYILRKESSADSAKAITTDSLDALLAAKKKRVIRVQQQLPLFIRYIGVEGWGGKLVLHEDIYEDDKRIRETVFASK